METKSKPGTIRLPSGTFGHVDNSGKLMKYPVLPDNTPRVVGIRKGGDKKFLASNSLQKVQQIFA